MKDGKLGVCWHMDTGALKIPLVAGGIYLLCGMRGIGHRRVGRCPEFIPPLWNVRRRDS
jgi:hypothetical protein